MNKTVDNIPYLCCVADTNEFYGIDNPIFKDWETKARKEFAESDSKDYEEWLINKYIPIFDKDIKSDFDMIYLPKVFKAKKYLIDKILSFSTIMNMNMNISVNKDKKLVLIL